MVYKVSAVKSLWSSFWRSPKLPPKLDRNRRGSAVLGEASTSPAATPAPCSSRRRRMWRALERPSRALSLRSHATRRYPPVAGLSQPRSSNIIGRRSHTRTTSAAVCKYRSRSLSSLGNAIIYPAPPHSPQCRLRCGIATSRHKAEELTTAIPTLPGFHDARST